MFQFSKNVFEKETFTVEFKLVKDRFPFSSSLSVDCWRIYSLRSLPLVSDETLERDPPVCKNPQYTGLIYSQVETVPSVECTPVYCLLYGLPTGTTRTSLSMLKVYHSVSAVHLWMAPFLGLRNLSQPFWRDQDTFVHHAAPRAKSGLSPLYWKPLNQVYDIVQEWVSLNLQGFMKGNLVSISCYVQYELLLFGLIIWSTVHLLQGKDTRNSSV